MCCVAGHVPAKHLEKMSSAIQSLQKAIVEGKQPLTQLLRLTKLIAAKLNVTVVEEWVDLELNGYPAGKRPPQYREVTTDRLMLHNPYRGWEHVGDVRLKMPVYQPIAELEALAEGGTVTFAPERNFPITDQFGESSGSDWPQRLTVTPPQLKGVLEAVRNKLLEWSLELEKMGIKGEDLSFDEKEKASARTMIFNLVGDNARVNCQSTDVSTNAANASNLG